VADLIREAIRHVWLRPGRGGPVGLWHGEPRRTSLDHEDLHKLSAVDALSFVLMAERRIRVAFAFDGHFAAAGFRMVG
jgi:hypothetical protein